MRKSRVIGFNAKRMAEDMMKVVIEEQNNRLIAYAQETVTKIGNQIQTFHSKNNMDRTGNLLDSLCWGVSYQGKLVKGGFYRERKASQDSYLHEWFSADTNYLYPVNGHMFAEEYIEKYGNNSHQGWKVFFAILAPYWGYWEKGFTLKSNYGKKSRFVQFAVMSQFFDQAKQDLKPARVRYRVSIAKYSQDKVKKRSERDFSGKIKDYYKY